MALRSILPFRSGAVLAAALLAAACGGGGGGSDSGNPGGSNPLAVDTSFGDNGSVRIALDPYNGLVSSLVEQTDGKLLVAGHRKLEPQVVVESGTNQVVRPRSVVFVNRYLANGQPDAGFGTGGAVEFSVRGADQAPQIKLVEGENFYVVVSASKPCQEKFTGRYTECLAGNVVETLRDAWARISQAGAVDTGVPEEGLTQAQLPPSLQHLTRGLTKQNLMLSDGRYLELQTQAVVAGGIYGWTLKRYKANGEVDKSFATDGVAGSRCNAADPRLLMDRARNIWVVGLNKARTAGAVPGLCLEKLSEDGQPSAGTPELVNTDLGMETSIQSVRFLDDGELMVVVSAYPETTAFMKALKYKADGSLNTGYGVKGIADIGGLDAAQAMSMTLKIQDGAGSIEGVRAGTRNSANNVNQPNLWARWKADASPDLGFGQGGILSLGDLPDFSRRTMALVDQKKRWILQTHTSQGAGQDVAGAVTLTRYMGESQ